MKTLHHKAIYITEWNGKWYLSWSDTKETIASFHSQFEAYSARRAILNSWKNTFLHS
jgi:hypothetical protein